MPVNLAEARAGLYHPTDPRITNEVLFEAISEAYYKVMVEGMRPKADFEVRVAKEGLDVMTKKLWRPGINNFQAALRITRHLPDSENRGFCVLVADVEARKDLSADPLPESRQGVPIDPLVSIHRRDLQNLQAQESSAETDAKIRETRWTIDLLRHNSAKTLLTPQDDEWLELQELIGYQVFQLRPDQEEGSTYDIDGAISVAQMQSPVFAFFDREWKEKVGATPRHSRP